MSFHPHTCCFSSPIACTNRILSQAVSSLFSVHTYNIESTEEWPSWLLVPGFGLMCLQEVGEKNVEKILADPRCIPGWIEHLESNHRDGLCVISCPTAARDWSTLSRGRKAKKIKPGTCSWSIALDWQFKPPSPLQISVCQPTFSHSSSTLIAGLLLLSSFAGTQYKIVSAWLQCPCEKPLGLQSVHQLCCTSLRYVCTHDTETHHTPVTIQRQWATVRRVSSLLFILIIILLLILPVPFNPGVCLLQSCFYFTHLFLYHQAQTGG